MLTLARFKASVLFTFPVVLISTLGCFHLFKQCVTYMTEDYYQNFIKQFSGPFLHHSIFGDRLFWLCFRRPFVATSGFCDNGILKASIARIKP